MEKLQDFAAPVGRFFLALMFVMSGFNKIGGYEGTQGYMEAMGVPGALLPLVILLELVGGIALIVGFKTRYVAIAFAGFCFISAILFHANFEDQMQMIMFMKNLSLAGAFLILFALGAGPLSLDNRKAA
ncbi:MAG: DoxX family protein [Alphaproteobacteria bacterium]|nr:DoxX family protein [Alphaproteobacteria bacterium]